MRRSRFVLLVSASVLGCAGALGGCDTNVTFSSPPSDAGEAGSDAHALTPGDAFDARASTAVAASDGASDADTGVDESDTAAVASQDADQTDSPSEAGATGDAGAD
jgi:hypothetical protein